MKTKIAETAPMAGTQLQEAPAMIETAGQERVLSFIRSEKPLLSLGITPETITPFVENKVSVLVQRGTGSFLFIPDIDYADCGAALQDDTASIIAPAHVIVKTEPFSITELQQMRTGQILLSPFFQEKFTQTHHELIAQKQLTAIAYNLIDERNSSPCIETISQQFQDEIARQNEFTKFITPLISNLIFNKEIRTAIQTSPEILQGTYYYKGTLTHKETAEKHGLPFRNIMELCWNWN